MAIAFKAFISKELNKEFVIIQPASNKTEKIEISHSQCSQYLFV
jgi:hypothetical protein